MLAIPCTCPLYAPIARVLTYYGIFHHPLAPHEIHLFLPVQGIPEAELQTRLDELVADGRLGAHRGYYFLPESGIDVVDRRIEMESRGDRMWKIARFVASIIRHTPFVQGIFVSGQLCRYLADRDSDIDFFVVVAPQRLWIVRTIFVAIRRILLFNSRKYFCTNYYVTADNLEIRERSLYVANEVASLKPIHNRSLYEQFLQANGWIREYYPNFDPDKIEYRRGVSEGSGLRRLLERLLPKRLAPRLDLKLMKATRKYWRKRYPGHDDRFYDVSLRSRRNESRAHPQDRAGQIADLYTSRIRSLGIDDG